MYDEFELFDFPDLPDEAVIALDGFLLDFRHAFENHYCEQLNRHYQTLAQRTNDNQLTLPIDDPPF